MEINPSAYYTYEKGDFVILTTGDIVCVQEHDAEGKKYVVTDAKSDGTVYDYKFVDLGTNKREICGKTIYMPVHQEFTIH